MIFFLLLSSIMEVALALYLINNLMQQSQKTPAEIVEEVLTFRQVMKEEQELRKHVIERKDILFRLQQEINTLSTKLEAKKAYLKKLKNKKHS